MGNPSRVFARDRVVLKEMCRTLAVMVKLSTWRGFKIGLKPVRHAFGYVCWCFWGANWREKTHLNVCSTMRWGSGTKGREGQPSMAFSLPQLPGSHKVNGSILSHCPAAMIFGPSVQDPLKQRAQISPSFFKLFLSGSPSLQWLLKYFKRSRMAKAIPHLPIRTKCTLPRNLQAHVPVLGSH